MHIIHYEDVLFPAGRFALLLVKLMVDISEFDLCTRSTGWNDVQLKIFTLKGQRNVRQHLFLPYIDTCSVKHHNSGITADHMNPASYPSHRFGGVRDQAQRFLQAEAVLVHADGKVAVALVHRGDPFLNLARVGVALFTKPIGELDQQLHPLFGLLGRERTGLISQTQADQDANITWKNPSRRN